MVALLFFVMMAVIGSVILAAASAGMGRVKDEDEGDQERYALYSAAKMIEKAFAGQEAFTKLSNYNTEKQQLTIPATSAISYYINSDTGEEYEDQGLTREYNLADHLQWTVPQFAGRSSVADKLQDIPELLAEQILNDYWVEEIGNFKENDLGTTIAWSDFIKNPVFNKKKNGEKVITPKKVSFTITPNSNWTEKATEEEKEYQIAQADVTMKTNLDIKVEIHLQDQRVAYQTYIVEIPFGDTAQIQLGTDPQKEEPYLADAERNVYGQHVTASSSVAFKNFQWKDKKYATITTLPDGNSDSQAEDGDDST